MTDSVLDPGSAADAALPSRSQHILAAAARCFARSGFHGTSMHEICQEAGMSPGAVYRYFRAKDDIISAIAEEERARNVAILSRDSHGERFSDHIVQLGLAFLTEMARPGQAALMAEVMAECLRNSQIGQTFAVNEVGCRQILGDLLAQAVAKGEIEPPADVDAAMSCLMAIGEGLSFRMAADPLLTIERVEPLLRQVGWALFKPALRLAGSGPIEPITPTTTIADTGAE